MECVSPVLEDPKSLELSSSIIRAADAKWAIIFLAAQLQPGIFLILHMYRSI